MLCSIDGNEIKDFHIDYGKVYHALAYDEDNCRTISNDDLTKADNEFCAMCSDFEPFTEVELVDKYFDVISLAEAMAFEIGVKFAIGMLAQNSLKGKDNSD